MRTTTRITTLLAVGARAARRRRRLRPRRGQVVKVSSHGKKITGRLQVAYSYLLPIMDLYSISSVPYVCRGNARFTASPR